MRFNLDKPGAMVLLATAAIAAASGSALAQQLPPSPPPANPEITVNGAVAPSEAMPEGPEVRGVITARSGDRMKVTGADGTSTVVTINDATKVSASGGLFGIEHNTLTASSLLNGLPVTVKTLQSGTGLLASQISFRSSDLKTASMIHNGTAQQFGEQAAATQALRSRMGDIDKYDIKSTTNVHFASGKADLSAEDKADLCAAATAAEGIDNALMLVVGYTDSTGNADFNQKLSELRASHVINYLQQACHWKPYRMLTPTGMAEADPLASNDTPEGKAQNRRVSVNILVSKAVDGM